MILINCRRCGCITLNHWFICNGTKGYLWKNSFIWSRSSKAMLSFECTIRIWRHITLPKKAITSWVVGNTRKYGIANLPIRLFHFSCKVVMLHWLQSLQARVWLWVCCTVYSHCPCREDSKESRARCYWSCNYAWSMAVTFRMCRIRKLLGHSGTEYHMYVWTTRSDWGFSKCLWTSR